jgi:chemotaxis protein histidine kinase CheA
MGEMTSVRRAFHTLKGSSLVGLKDFGEAAWGCEQLFSARLADGGLPTAMLGFSGGARLSGSLDRGVASSDTAALTRSRPRGRCAAQRPPPHPGERWRIQ